jgi:DNA replication and repair protein RecF
MNLIKLKLYNFRNYGAKNFHFQKNIIIFVGKNGTGKTNVLEAISLLSSSKGLRSAKLEELKNFNSSEAIWSINSVFENNEIETEIGTYLDFTKETKKEKRIIKIDGNIISKKSIIDEYTSVIFLTPDMDQIFSDGLTSRRSFLDKICEFFFKHYSDLMGAYNKLKSDRLRLILKNYNNNSAWISALEKQIVEKAVAIAFYRLEAIGKLNNQTEFIEKTSFPSFNCDILGEVENLLKTKKAIEVENIYLQKLQETRTQDFETKKTNFGIHKSDFKVLNKTKNLLTENCSTGEQKAILISLTLACVLHKKNWEKTSSLILLDEVASHLDKFRRDELFELISNLNCQLFLTGTDREVFENLGEKAEIFEF